jgi:hypothetical protein
VIPNGGAFFSAQEAIAVVAANLIVCGRRGPDFTELIDREAATTWG